MKVKILTFDKVDEQGDLFTKDSVRINNPVMLTQNFDHTKPLGKVDVTAENDGLYTELDSEKYKGLYPSIGFEIIKSEQKEDGITEIQELKLHYVGLSYSENIDPSIKPL